MTIQTLGMSPARRRLFEAGIHAQAAMKRETARREAEREEANHALIAQRLAERRAFAAVSRPKAIIAAIAQRHGVTVAENEGPRRLIHIVRARQEAMWEVRQAIALSLPAIGRHFGGRDHTTVLWGIRRHEARLAAMAAGVGE